MEIKHDDINRQNYMKLIRTFLLGIIVILVPVVCYFTGVSKSITVTSSIVVLLIWTILLVYNLVSFIRKTSK